MDDQTAIRNLLERQYPAHLNAGDVDGYVDLYGQDVVWGVPNLPDATSPAQIASLLRKILGKVEQTIEVIIDDLLITDDLAIAMAVATGTAKRRPDGESQPLALRVMWALRRDESGWKIIRQVGTPKPAG